MGICVVLRAATSSNQQLRLALCGPLTIAGSSLLLTLMLDDASGLGRRGGTWVGNNILLIYWALPISTHIVLCIGPIYEENREENRHRRLGRNV